MYINVHRYHLYLPGKGGYVFSNVGLHEAQQSASIHTYATILYVASYNIVGYIYCQAAANLVYQDNSLMGNMMVMMCLSKAGLHSTSNY